MQRLGRAAIVILGIALTISVGYPYAQSLLEKLVIPGPVATAHEKYEAQCDKCHASFSQKAQTSRCLDCHKEIAADRQQRVSFHGKQADARERECRACHVEHKGRDADILLFDRERFDHDITNYKLVDAHRTADCNGCHAPHKPFHKTPTKCAECHKKDDTHKGRLGDRCDTCHEPTKWRQVKTFDHGKTKFPLEGAHKDVGCATCHAGEVYKDLAQNCVSCHRIQDIHGGRYGVKCETCHGQTKWTNAKFDHDTKTKYPLRGAHVRVKCDACHTGNITDKLGTTCVACHKQQDPHKGQLGERCERCHNEIDWRKGITFNHNETRFPLVGKHAAAACSACHNTLTFKGAPLECSQCHKDSVHQGRLGANPNCGDCHNAFAWSQWRFDHGKRTRFALTGAHAHMKCEGCHSARNPPSLKLPMACEACHKDSVHQGRLGAQPKCASCHDTVAFSHWRFDHARQADYPLIGAHARIKCESCHSAPNPPSLKLSVDCASCHRKEDAHMGAFGRNCERCHSPLGWRKVNVKN